MNQLDVYYRALLDYKKQTEADNNCSNLRASIAATDPEEDKIVVKRSSCSIEEDWVQAIEEGLVHIEKAIKEERQFIRSNGEVVPIEKVKHVSRESVEHLAKHSNLISRYEDEEDDIVPDKLYTVERLNDYAVYENRFLYMLLSYLRDFVTLRYNDIIDLTNKYDATLNINKEVHNGKEKLSYAVSMHDVRQDDEYLKAHNPNRDIIDRIDLISKAIIAFLSTPLMEEMAKIPMIKPPITKTNVLKMNNNFKGAMALYDFIISYDKKGYTVETEEKVLCPFKDDLADDMAETVSLVSFLTYQYGLDIKAELKDAYLREEANRQISKIKRRAERIETLKRRMVNSEITIEEYTIQLENQLRDLENQAVRAESLTEQLYEEKEKNKQLSDRIDMLNDSIDDIKEQHSEEIEQINKNHETTVQELIVRNEAEIDKLVSDHNATVKSIKDAAAETEQKLISEINTLKEDTRAKIDSITATSEKAVKIAEEKFNICVSELSKLTNEHNVLLEEKRVAEARVKALYGVSKDHTDKDSFDELEREYKAFTRVYEQQWRKTKKKIKQKHLNVKNLKGQKENTGKGE